MDFLNKTDPIMGERMHFDSETHLLKGAAYVRTGFLHSYWIPTACMGATGFLGGNGESNH